MVNGPKGELQARGFFAEPGIRPYSSTVDVMYGRNLGGFFLARFLVDADGVYPDNEWPVLIGWSQPD